VLEEKEEEIEILMLEIERMRSGGAKKSDGDKSLD